MRKSQGLSFGSVIRGNVCHIKPPQMIDVRGKEGMGVTFLPLYVI